MTINLQMNGRWQLWRSVLKCQTYNPVSWALANSNDIFFYLSSKKMTPETLLIIYSTRKNLSFNIDFKLTSCVIAYAIFSYFGC